MNPTQFGGLVPLHLTPIPEPVTIYFKAFSKFSIRNTRFTALDANWTTPMDNRKTKFY